MFRRDVARAVGCKQPYDEDAILEALDQFVKTNARTNKGIALHGCLFSKLNCYLITGNHIRRERYKNTFACDSILSKLRYEMNINVTLGIDYIETVGPTSRRRLQKKNETTNEIHDQEVSKLKRKLTAALKVVSLCPI